MNNLDLFGKTFSCSCGRRHSIEPRKVLFTADALSQLPAVCTELAGGAKLAAVMDVRTRQVAGARAVEALTRGGWEVKEVVVADGPAGRLPVCDETMCRAIEQAAGGGVGAVVSVGSGVVTDLGKWMAFRADVPFVAVATAASMNGYASANVAPTIAGVKSLFSARAASAVLAEPDVIAAAPNEMTAAGLGDVLAKSVSSADWRVNQILFGDYYCGRAVALIDELEPMYLRRPEDLRERKPQAVEALFHALILTGVAMTMAGNSTPASGGEHLISHSLDMMSALDGVSHDLHGRQVGVGTILAGELYRRVLAVESPVLSEPAEGIDRPFWGSLADVVAGQYAGKIERLRIAKAALSGGGTWDRLRQEVQPMLRGPERIRDCLTRGGAAHLAEHIGCTRRRLLGAFIHAHEIRPRFTVIDLARLVGVLPAAAEEIVEQWA